MTEHPIDALKRIEARATTRLASLPSWPEWVRAAPAAVLRSALFGLVERGTRGHCSGIITSWSGVEVYYEGEALDQADLDVWLQTLHHCRTDGQFVVAKLNAATFLRSLGRAAGKGGRDWLFASIERLHRGSISVIADEGRRKYAGYLIAEHVRDEVTGEIRIGISPMVATLFGSDFVQIPWDIRLLLQTGLAKWLHGYIRSHRTTVQQPHRVTLDRLRTLCGSSRPDLKYFARDVRSAMKEVEQTGEVVEWKVERGVLVFIRAVDNTNHM